MSTNADVGRRVRQAREELGLSQGALGRLMSPSRTHAAVSDIERGKTHLDVEDLSALAALLQKELAYFYEEGSAPGAVPSTLYRRGDRGLTPQAQRHADQAIEAFKRAARARVQAMQDRDGR